MRLDEHLEAEPVTHLDLSYYCLVDVGTPVRDVLAAMRKKGCNCALVVQEDRLVGVFTDRDVLMKITDHPELLDQVIDQVMTKDPKTVTTTTSAADALTLMDSHHFRNVPVLGAKGAPVGNFTYFAVLKYLADMFPVEVYNRPPETARFTRRRDGA